jgi:predicted chitinase
VSDQGALSADASALSPHWWQECVPAYGPQPASAVKASQPVFGEVVIPPVPIAINAGDNIGHLGFYQLPEENGKRSRYQAHIECLSMDANLPDFLKNPDRVGEQEPAYLKYPQAAPLFVKNTGGQMVDSTRKTRTQGIATLFNVPVEKIDGQPAYYQIHRESGWLAAASVQKLSQYALAELGFITLDKAPESFDLIDGSKHPDNVVKGILERLYQAAQDETRTSHALNKYNYKRLLEMIDSQRDGHYSEKEYLQAVHNVSYRDYLYRIIVKHASEWYYGKDDPLWKTYLDTLTLDAPQWKTYTEALIDNMTWMKKVDGMGPEPWHMHPVVFLRAISNNIKIQITVEMLYKVFNRVEFPNKQKFLFQFAEEINKNADVYKLNSIRRINHFFAQVREEMGPRASPVEDLNYSEDGLKANFRYFRDHPDEANLFSYKKIGKVITVHANEIAIANRVYSNRLGNGSISSEDGSKYRGRGAIHLTGKANYQGFSDFSKSQWGDNIDFIYAPILLEEAKYCVRSAVYFWLKEKLYTIADEGDSGIIVDKITAKVNLNTSSYGKRREHYAFILSHKIFDRAF